MLCKIHFAPIINPEKPYLHSHTTMLFLICIFPPSHAHSSPLILLPLSLKYYRILFNSVSLVSPLSPQNAPNSSPLPSPSSLFNPFARSGMDMWATEIPHLRSGDIWKFPCIEIIACPHQWLYEGTLLCLLDAKHRENTAAFQMCWKRNKGSITFPFSSSNEITCSHVM